MKRFNLVSAFSLTTSAQPTSHQKSKTSRYLLIAALTALACLLVASMGWAQTTTAGTVVGQVVDPSSAVVPGATVTLTDAATGTSRQTATNDQGRYVFINVAPGNYSVTVNKSGFTTARIAQQGVQVGQATTINVQLQVGAATQTVEVQATGATELQTLNATVGNTMPSIALQALPSLGRDVSTFATLQPGVSPDGSVAGTVVDQSTFQLDGGNNTNDMDGSMQVYTSSFAGDATGGVTQNQVGAPPTGVMPTPQDSIEEFKVNTANQTADFNSSAGAQVQVATKRGGNSWHGAAYEYYEDNNFNANTWDNNLSGTPIPNWHRSRFGASIGGPIIPKSILGGKTYFFGFYQGFRWPNSETFERSVPSADMRNGFLTFKGVRYDLKALDPRGIGISPVVQQMWNKYMPAGNDPSCTLIKGSKCDGVNEIGFKANVGIPQSDNYGVARLDHDFGANWHFFGSYRYYRLNKTSNCQIDIGGFFPGNKLGTPTSVCTRPQLPWYWVAGLTTTISPTVTNDFHYSFLRNWWQWGTQGAPPQIAGLGAALEPFGESRTTVLVPYNVNTQNVRTRYWDGLDNYIRDDITMLHGNHLFQFGGAYQRNHDKHQRTDNGGGINYYPVYQLGLSGNNSAGLVDFTSMPAPSTTTASTWERDVSAVLGIVNASQVAYTRSGSNLTLNPPLTPANEDSTIPYYNVYWSDSWKVRPSLTVTYGLGYTLQMPPVDKLGRQIELVDQSNRLIDTDTYIKTKERLALQGQVYNPVVGFTLVGNSENGRKYPYDPFYGGFSPRVAVAWNPKASEGFLGKFLGNGNTVIRGGYGRIYGRLNGVDLVLVPLLGTGLIQPVQCFNALASGACDASITPVVGNPGAGEANVFRIGVDGMVAPLAAATPTLPQPDFPGINAAAAGAGEGFDPHFRPNVTDTFTLSLQRQMSQKFMVELGYIGRLIHHEYQPINLNAVPYMMTLGGQQFQSAYANIERGLGCATSYNACGTGNPAAIPNQPFFEAALGPTGYCQGFTSCTQAVIANEMDNFTSQSVWSLWSDLDQGGPGGGPPCSAALKSWNGTSCNVVVNGVATTVGPGIATTVPGFNFARSMLNSPIYNAPCVGSEPNPCGIAGQLTSGVGVNASIGHGNYNGGYFSARMSDWHGLTAQTNLTWAKAMGTGAFVQATSEYTTDDPFNIDRMYGLQAWDRKFVYNFFVVYQPSFFRGQPGVLGRLLGGWTFSPIFTAGTGIPMLCNTLTGSGFSGGTGAQEYGAADGEAFANPINCIFNSGRPSGSASVHTGVHGSDGVGTTTAGSGLDCDPNCGAVTYANVFADPAAAFNLVRPPILGLDTRNGGIGNLRGLPYWNMDMSIAKAFKVTERVGFTASAVFTNVFNHRIFYDPVLDAANPDTWGVLSAQGNAIDGHSRAMEFGLRVSF